MPSEGDLGPPLAGSGRNIIQDYHIGSKRCFCPEKKVGILGAGIAGLYAALILDSLDIEYEILETSDHTGGRISTYKFPNGGKYDYYDSGAMRFPFPKRDSYGRYHDGVMRRLAMLTEYGPLNEGQDRLKDSIIPFYYHARDSSKPGFYYFNNIREPVSNAPKGSFSGQEMGVDADYIRAGADAIVDDVLGPFIRLLLRDVATGRKDGWEALLAHDSYTVRSYMATKYLPSPHLGLPPKNLPDNVINWCGLIGLGDGSDDALVETVLSTLAFTKGNTNYTDIHWKCFEGGTETLTKKIEEYLNTKGSFIRLGKRVTAISQDHMIIKVPADTPDHALPANARGLLDDFIGPAIDKDKFVDGPPGLWREIKIPSVAIEVNGHEKLNYSHVISTLPLPVLRNVDLDGAGLNVMQKNALRSLRYITYTKVAILFKSNWWTTKLGIIGGETATDLPIGTIVYPSYGVDSSTPSKVLIASYCWYADANHLGSLTTPQHLEALRELVLRNLAEVHSGLHPDVTYEYLVEEFVEMHAKDWNREPYAMGACTYFGPGQFRDLYTSLTFPAAGKSLHFAGEAVSRRHCWVVGALDSSWRAIYEYLNLTGQDEKMEKFKALWGANVEWTIESSPANTAE